MNAAVVEALGHSADEYKQIVSRLRATVESTAQRLEVDRQTLAAAEIKHAELTAGLEAAKLAASA